jgi:NADH-quinone oxidoreductase subunit L
MIEFAWLIPVLPLAAFLVISFITRPWKQLSGYVAVAAIFASFLLALPIIREVMAGGHGEELFVWESSFTWLPLADGNALQLGVLVDPLAAVMLLVVTSVSFLVMFYSQGYMHGDPGYSRYFAFISLFAMSMLGVVLANSLLTLFIFWELVGLSSFLLIGFWYQKPEAAAAAKKAFLVTRLADFGLLTGILLLWSRAGTLEFSAIEAMIAAGQFDAGFMSLVGILIFCGAAGKSAQFPFHVWLPDAMEGPTPVSALIHAATMVAAGVYLVARAFPIFEAGPMAMTVVLAIGTFTAIFAATMALVNNDIKRVMAYSTLSQLGYMMLALGAGAKGAAMFHLMNHAFFKAMLFLTAGSVIHALGTQDLRYMGGLRRYMPITSITMLIGALSLAGFPLITSGFWSKDEILAAAYDQGYYLVFVVGLITAFLTAFYMFRAWFLAFWGEPRWQVAGGSGHGDDGAHDSHDSHDSHGSHGSHGGGRPHESPWVMTLPLIVLAVPSVISGFWGSPLTGNAFGAFLEGHGEVHVVPVVIAGSVVVALGGIYLAWLMYGARSLSPERVSSWFGPLYTVLYNKYWVDEAYNWFMRVGVLGLANAMRVFDTYVIDGAVNGVATVTRYTGATMRQLQTGRLQNYGWAMYAGAMVIALVVLAGQFGR